MKYAYERNQESRDIRISQCNLSDDFYQQYFYEINAINDLIENAVQHGRFVLEGIDLSIFNNEEDKRIFINYMDALGYTIESSNLRWQTDYKEQKEYYYISWLHL